MQGHFGDKWASKEMLICVHQILWMGIWYRWDCFEDGSSVRFECEETEWAGSRSEMNGPGEGSYNMNSFVSAAGTCALLQEIRGDLKKFGSERECLVWYILVNGVPRIINYDYFTEKKPIQANEINPGEAVTKMKLGDVCRVLEAQ